MRIALCGEPRSGKDTCAKLLRGFYRLAFGDYMKKGYYKKHPEMLDKPKDREHMIEFSQPLVDHYCDIWVDMLSLELNLREELEVYAPFNWVITDLRQPHEEEWCRANGFHIVRVHSPLEKRKHRMQEFGEVNGNDLPYEVQADFHVYNDGSLGDLQKSLENLLPILEIADKIKEVTRETNKYYKNYTI